MRFSHIVAGLCVVVLALIAGWFIVAPQTTPKGDVSAAQRVQLDGQTIRVSVADTEASRELGLGGRASLAPDQGMLFVFPIDGRYSFWMKDIRFSLDMLWLSADGRVVYMAQQVSPDTYPRALTPDVPARYVLELPAGYAAAHGVRIGDTVQL